MPRTLESLLGNPDSAPFWQGLQEDRFLLQQCRRCRRYRYYPRNVCPHCLSLEFTWEAASGRGTVYSVTTVRKAPAGFDMPAPYQVALIDLDEGVRVLCNIAASGAEDPSGIRIGMRAALCFRTSTSGMRLPFFEPAT